MPKRFPGWAESGARLLLDVDIDFTDVPSPTREQLVGPKDMTSVLKVCSGTGPSTFVSEFGEQKVTFTNGGWSIQRPTGNVKNAAGSLVKPEGLLCFWLDCENGATRRDVEIKSGTRIFFTTGVWDDPAGLESQKEEYNEIVMKLQNVVDETRETTEKEETNNMLEQAFDFRKMVGNAKEFDNLKLQKEALERTSPPKGASKAKNGVQIAPTGSMVIKGNNIPDWLPGSECLILGTFTTKSLDEQNRAIEANVV